MRCLVTGGGGFLGRYVVEQLLQRGDSVRVFSRRRYSEVDALGVESRQGDIRDAEAVLRACRGMECVFHTAALPGISLRPRPFYDTNLRGTENVLAACRQHAVERLVYTSSPSVVFAGEDQCGVDESAPLALEWLDRNRCYYAHSKALAEQKVLAANRRGLRTCALRPHLIWGPRDGHLVPRLIQRARDGRLRRIGDGTNRIDMIYVENAAEAHLLACEALGTEPSPAAGRAYFLSQGEPRDCWQWIDELLTLVDLPPVKRHLSRRSAERVGWLLELAYRQLRLRGEPPMTRFLAAQLATSHWFDISAARRDLGYQPRVSVSQGMQRLKLSLADQA